MKTPTRAEQNAINAQKSTGPKTAEGKAASRANSMKHGLTAEVLTLPTEDPAIIQKHINVWTDAIDPANGDEQELAEQIALHALRIERLARAENAVIGDQIDMVEQNFDTAEQHRIIDLVKKFSYESAHTLIDLQTFSAGVAFLIERWTAAEVALMTDGRFDDLKQLQETLRLQGYDPNRLQNEHSDAYVWARMAASCFPDLDEYPDLATYIDNQSAQPSNGETFRWRPYETERAKKYLMDKIDATLNSLQYLKLELETRENARIERGKDKALIPEDTPANRLMMRYMKANESGLDRALKTLMKLQSERQKTAEREAREKAREARQAVSRNEAKPAGKSPKVSAQSKSYVADVKAAEAELEKSIQAMMMGLSDDMKRQIGMSTETIALGAIQTAKMAV